MKFVKIGPYQNLTPSQPKMMNFALAGYIFAALIAVSVSLICLVLFILNSIKKEMPSTSKIVLTIILLLIILNGTIIRLMLASTCFGNHDMQCWEVIADIAAKDGNVYNETHKYVYTPVFFEVLRVIKNIQLNFPSLTLHFLIKTFLSIIDLMTLGVLLLIAKNQKISPIKTALFFYLNPVSFLITGYHGQFENMAVLLIVIGIFAYIKLKKFPLLANLALWLFSTVGMIVKHNVLYEVLICLNHSIKRRWIIILLFTLSVGLFLATFLPYWADSKENIINDVFKHSSGNAPGRYSSDYGINSLIQLPFLKYIFVLGMLTFPFLIKKKELMTQCILGFLFFLVFTTGIAVQYFVLPIALGALRPSKGFLIYSIAASLFILGCFYNVYSLYFDAFKWNFVWFGAIYWFYSELKSDNNVKPSLLEIKEQTPMPQTQ